jgi:hypothetical protein
MEHPSGMKLCSVVMCFKYRTQRGLPLMRIKSQSQSDQAKAAGHAVCGKSESGVRALGSVCPHSMVPTVGRVGPQKADTALAKGKPLRRLSECSRSGSGA